MVQRHAVFFEKGDERSYLVTNHGLHLGARDLHLTSAEADKIWQAWMRTDANAMGLGERHGRVHGLGFPGMKTAGYVRDIDQRHESFVVAEAVEPKGFPHVGIHRYLWSLSHFVHRSTLRCRRLRSQ